MTDIWQWTSQAEYDDWIEQLCALIPNGDEAEHSNPEGSAESIILDCFIEYRRQLDSSNPAPDLNPGGGDSSPRELDLDALEALREVGTPGPWRVYDRQEVWCEDGNLLAGEHNADGFVVDPADAELIVTAVNVLPELIAAARERDRFAETVARVRELVADVGNTSTGPTYVQCSEVLNMLDERDSNGE